MSGIGLKAPTPGLLSKVLILMQLLSKGLMLNVLLGACLSMLWILRAITSELALFVLPWIQ